ncbi:hypothetical protein SAMN05421812_10139 [Asanoa hainanensis]|uniref:Uncharacterized protein n=1 Tax=Asanoa hainanensis TaxID=560556 RepID=A0A239FSX2_9ACTN|nr:hypothetical protein [Asanoa hainanensis]SNS59292.1 hypothetical protein SAMN05421812_10139 [Asanoa hainanensis]
MSSFARVVVLFALLAAAAGIRADPPWSLWLAGIALLTAAAVLALELRMRRYEAREEARRSAYADRPRTLATRAVRSLTDDIDEDLSRADYARRMRHKASRTAPASRRLRPPPYRAALSPIGDPEDHVDTIAERVAQRMKWDALWWFLAAVAVSIPVGIFVNQIS